MSEKQVGDSMNPMYTKAMEIKATRRSGRPPLPEDQRLIRYAVCLPPAVLLWAFEVGAEHVRKVLVDAMEAGE